MHQTRSLSVSLSLSPPLCLSLYLFLSLSLSQCLQLPPANLFEKPFVTFGLALFTLGAPVCPPVWLLDMYRHVDIVHTIILYMCICILRVQYTYIYIHTIPDTNRVCGHTQFLAFLLCTHFRRAYYNFTVNSIWPRCFSFFFFLFFLFFPPRGNLIARIFS